MIPFIIGLVLLCTLLWIASALGRRILKWLRIHPSDSLEHGILALGIGLGALQFLPFVLFSAGIGTPTGIRIACGIVGLLLWKDFLAAVHAARRLVPHVNHLNLWQRVFLAAIAALLVSLFLRTVCPPTDGDALTYHLTVAYRYLQNGRFVFLPTIVHTNWPLGVEMLFALILGLNSNAPPATAHFALGLVGLGACYLLGRRIVGPFGGAAAITLLLLHKGYWAEFTLAYIDLGMAAFATLAVLSLQNSRRDSAQPHRWILASAVFAGLAATSKLTGVWVIASLSIIILISNWPNSPNFGDRLQIAAKFVFAASCVVMPWFLKTWILTGNPIYPAFYGIFGGKEWTATGYARLHEFYLRLNTPPGYPPTQQVLWWSHAILTVCGILIALITIYSTRKSQLAIPARFAALFTAFVWAFSIFNLRFLTAAVPSLAVCLMACFGRVERRAAGILCGITVLLTILLALRIDPDLPEASAIAFGVKNPREYQMNHILDFEIVEFANRNLPEDSVILASALAHNTALYRARTLVADYWTQDSIHYDSDQRQEEDIRRLGVTHLVIQTEYPDWCAASAACAVRQSIEQASLLRLAARVGRKLASTDKVALYSLNLD